MSVPSRARWVAAAGPLATMLPRRAFRECRPLSGNCWNVISSLDTPKFLSCVHVHGPSRRSPPAILLRESFSQDGKSRKRTLANLSKLPEHVRDRRLSQRRDNWRFRSHPRPRACGGCPWQPAQLRAHPRRSPQRDLVMAAARLPKTARRFAPATSTLAGELGLPENIDENHEAMDWLVERQNSMSPCREARRRSGALRPDFDVELPLPAGWLLPRRQKKRCRKSSSVRP